MAKLLHGARTHGAYYGPSNLPENDRGYKLFLSSKPVVTRWRVECFLFFCGGAVRLRAYMGIPPSLGIMGDIH